MISAKFLRPFSLFVFALLGFFPGANAQDAGYAPPPMFEDMTPPMVRPEADRNGNIVEPRVSPRENPQTSPAPVTATTRTAPVSQKPVVPPVKPKMMAPIIAPQDVQARKSPEKPEVKKPSAPAPVPPKKPGTKTPEKKPAEEPVAAPKVETPVAPTKPAAPKESAIQGPKTMPAIPAQSVDRQTTFESEAEPVERETMLERHQHEVAVQNKEEELKPIVPAPKANVAPASFDKNPQGALKKTIPFQQGQIGLSSAEIDPIAVGVNKELDHDDKKEWRVQIRSYATPYGTGVSSDKRIALSRALSLRTALIAQGVPAARIDVLAEGQSPDSGKQADRIDLYLYGPAQD